MSEVQDYGKRIRRALRVWAAQFETATYEEFGRRVAEIEGRDPAKGPYTASSVSEWLQSRSEPKIATFKAIETLTGFRAAWLMLAEMPERVDEGGQGGGNVVAATPPEPITPRATRREVQRTILDPLPSQRTGKARPKRRPDRSAMAG